MAALLRNGYQVFIAAAMCGPTDIVVLKDGAKIRVQVKTFYDRQRKDRGIHRVAELRASSTKLPGGHSTYEDSCDCLVLVDCDTSETYLVPLPFERRTLVHKAQLDKYKIFPIG